MADGLDLNPASRADRTNTPSEINETLQVSVPSPAPGVSSDKTVPTTSRKGVFQMLAGISPCTSSVVSDPQQQPFFAAARSSGSSTDLHNNSRAETDPGNNIGVTWSSPYFQPGYLDPRVGMAAPSAMQNNNMMMLLMEQCKQTKDLCRQQQASIDTLTKAVSALTQKKSDEQSVHSEGTSQYEPLSSDEDDSGDESISEPAFKRQRLTSASSAVDMSSSAVPLNTSTQSTTEPISTIATSSHTTTLSTTATSSTSADKLVCLDKLLKAKEAESRTKKTIQFGPAVHEVVASTVNNVLAEPIDHKGQAVDDLMGKYVRPENCEFLEVPRVNRQLWINKETDCDLKKADRDLQRVHKYLTKGMIPLVKLYNKTLSKPSEEATELFDWALDSLTMLGYAHRDLAGQRRQRLKPAINPRYASLCSEQEPITSPKDLFGDQKELEKKLTEIDASRKLGKSLANNYSGRHVRKGHNSRPQQTGPNHKGSRQRHFLGQLAPPRNPVHSQPQQHTGNRKRGRGQNGINNIGPIDAAGTCK